MKVLSEITHVLIEREKATGSEELMGAFPDEHFAQRFLHNLQKDFEDLGEEYEYIIRKYEVDYSKCEATKEQCKLSN